MTDVSRTILIADDEPHVTYMLALKLRQLGVRVVVANDGEQALALAREHKPDAIVTDFQMPRMSGFDMAMQLHADEALRHIPIIMLTARGHRLLPSELAQTSICHLMNKPFSAREVQERVAELLQLRWNPERAAA